MDTAQTLKPAALLHMLEIFADQPAQRKQIMKNILSAMRKDKYDVRQFSFTHLVHFMGIVA